MVWRVACEVVREVECGTVMGVVEEVVRGCGVGKKVRSGVGSDVGSGVGSGGGSGVGSMT